MGMRVYFPRNWERKKCKDWAVAAYVIAVLTPDQPFPEEKKLTGQEKMSLVFKFQVLG